MPFGLARVVHDGASNTVVAACADSSLIVADSPRLDSDRLMTFGFREVRIRVPGSSASGTARRHYPLGKFLRQLTFRLDCPNAHLPGQPSIPQLPFYNQMFQNGSGPTGGNCIFLRPFGA